MKILLKSFIDFFKDDGPILAGALSYFFIMALFPFCLFLISIFGYFLGENKAFYDYFLKELLYFFPQSTFEITKELKTIITYQRIGIVTLIIYGLFSYQLFAALDRSINLIFKQQAKRSFYISVLLSFLIATLIFVLLILSFSATTIISMLKYLNIFFPNLIINTITKILIGFIVPMLLVFLMATSIYIILPKKKVMLENALLGGLFTSIFFESAKHLFTFYFALKLSDLGTIYGPLSVFVLFILWIYYSASILLIGGEVVHNLEEKRKKEIHLIIPL